MLLRIDFGTNGARREATWYGMPESFPETLWFQGEVWERSYFEADSNKHYDRIIVYRLTTFESARWNNYVDFEARFGTPQSNGCECGSAYSWAPQRHMFFCPKWSK